MEKYSNEELQLFIKFIKEQNNLSTNELKKISDIYKRSKADMDLKEILDKLAANPNSSDKIINEYLNTIDLSESEDSALAQIYDVDTSDIEHKILEDGKEIIKFYCNKLNRVIVFEKEKNGMTLKEQLAEVQEENEQFQTSNPEKNTNDILEQERIYGDTELKMVPVNEIENYNYIIQKLSPEKRTSLNYMIRNASELHIDSINIENVFGITNNDYGSKIYEAYYDVERNKVIIEQPEEFVQSEQEELPNEKSELDNDDEMRKAEEKEKIDLYRNYPELLETLDNETRERYNKLINEVNIQESQLEKPKVYTLRNEHDRRAGYIDAAILALITGSFGAIFTTVIILICK